MAVPYIYTTSGTPPPSPPRTAGLGFTYIWYTVDLRAFGAIHTPGFCCWGPALPATCSAWEGRVLYWAACTRSGCITTCSTWLPFFFLKSAFPFFQRSSFHFAVTPQRSSCRPAGRREAPTSVGMRVSRVRRVTFAPAVGARSAFGGGGRRAVPGRSVPGEWSAAPPRNGTTPLQREVIPHTLTHPHTHRARTHTHTCALADRESSSQKIAKDVTQTSQGRTPPRHRQGMSRAPPSARSVFVLEFAAGGTKLGRKKAAVYGRRRDQDERFNRARAQEQDARGTGRHRAFGGMPPRRWSF
jgi:hypothetical protein